MRITVAYRGIPKAPGWETGSQLVDALRLLGHTVEPYGSYYQSPRWMGTGVLNPDLVIYLECCDGDPQYAQFKQFTCPVVYWEFDTEIHEEWSEKFIEYMGFDRVFMANKSMAEKYGALYLPYAACPTKFWPQPDGHSGVAMIGKAFKERDQFCRDAGVDLISSLEQPKYSERLRGLYAHVHFLDSGGSGMVVARPWETMASGVCLLAPRTDAMDEHFEPMVHYYPYNGTPGGCRDAVSYLKRDKDARDRIAKQGLNLIHKDHTYAHRAQSILNKVSV
jgi:hypothetical protein